MKRIFLALTLTFGLLLMTGSLLSTQPRGWHVAVAQEVPATPVTIAASTTPTVTQGKFPQVVARISITPSGNILDFGRDDVRGLLVASTANETVVISQTGLTIETRLPYGGELLVDAARGRLYVFPGPWGSALGGAAVVRVVDLETLREVAQLPNASYVDVDTAGDRVFTGNAWTPYVADEPTAPVRIYDGTDLSLTDELTTTGIPRYNPLRDDLLVLHESATVFDLATLLPVDELLPELVNPEIPFCNGCEYISAGTVFVDEGLLVLQLRRIATGAGPGLNPPPRFFDAETLAPVAEHDAGYQYVATCSSHPYLQEPIENKSYQNLVYRRYIVIENLLVESASGELIDLRDGTYAIFVSPNTRQAVLDQGYVVDLESLAPIGRFPAFCLLGYDAATGRIYGWADGDLLVMEEAGGDVPDPVMPEVGVGLTGTVAQIVPSPSYADDKTIFAFVAGQGVVRSMDGGASWSLLHGGLPETQRLVLDLAISPDFAADRTLYAGGTTNTYQGEGVLRSTDGGDTWTPLWRGLTYLRVRDVALAQDYAQSGTVAALADYNRLPEWETGTAIFTSTKHGTNHGTNPALTWTLAMTASTASKLPPLEAVVGDVQAEPQLPVRLAQFGDGISVTIDSGVTWELAELDQDENDYFKRIVAAPDYPDDPSIYVQSRFGLWRTLDGGATWTKWVDDRLVGRDYRNELTTIALARGAGPDSHWLFVGTAAGELWTLEVAQELAASLPVPVTPSTPTPVTTPTSTTDSAEVIPTATAVPLEGEPPAGTYRPLGTLTSRWESDPALQQEIGWATQQTPDSVQMARQDFTGGIMLWRGDTQQIYVIYNDNQWAVFDDTFEEGDPEFDPTITPPTGYRQPIRGFGKIWRENVDVREKIGWATDKEQGFGGFVHPFEHGVLLTGGDRTLALIDRDGVRTWR